MLSKETKEKIRQKFASDKAVLAMLAAHDVQGLVAKCKEIGFDVTEGDIAEYVISSDCISDDELSAVSGGCSNPLEGPCGKYSCHSDYD